MPVRLYNRVKVASATTGTGTLTLGAAASGYQTFANGGVANGEKVRYIIEDGSSWEYGIGTYASAGPTLARTTIIESSNSDNAINCSGNQLVAIVSGAEDHRGKQAIWVPATAMTPRTTNGAALTSSELSSNKVMVDGLYFDASTAEFAQFMVFMPSSWNGGTVTYKPVWRHVATTTNFGVSWKMAGRSFANDDALDAAFGTAIEVADTGGTTDDVYVGDESAALTITGAGSDELVIFQIQRDPADAQDNMAVDAVLLGIVLYINTISAVED